MFTVDHLETAPRREVKQMFNVNHLETAAKRKLSKYSP
jgi:hypothetical protein